MSLRDRYDSAMHSMQSAIAWLIKGGWDGASSKHNRVGIDSLKAEQAGLAQLLMDKGLFTWEEYEQAMVDAVEKEAKDYEGRAKKFLNLPDKTKFK